MDQLHSRIKFLIFFFVLIHFKLFSCETDSVISSQAPVHMFISSYSIQAPGGDLADRFGLNSLLTQGYYFKTKSNWIFGGEGSFLFGNQVKEDSLFRFLTNSKGAVLNHEGGVALINRYQRGFSGSLNIGKLFPIKAINEHSGILVMAGAGGLMHKIRIEPKGSVVSALTKEYREGYDRLSSGYALHQFIGFSYMSRSRLINLIGGFDFIQAITYSRRSYQFDLKRPITGPSRDHLNGFRLGIILPVYGLKKDEYYTN